MAIMLVRLWPMKQIISIVSSKNAGSNYGIVNSSFEKIDNLTKQKVDELANNITKIGDSESTPSSNTNTVGGVQPDIKPVWNGRGTAPYNK